MELVSTLALLLLTLLGYSCGRVLDGSRYDVAPTLVDSLIVLLLWGGALASQELFSHALLSHALLSRWLLILCWFMAGMVVGAIGTLLRRDQLPIPDELDTQHSNEYSDDYSDGHTAGHSDEQAADPLSRNIFKRGWERWKVFAHRMGNFQSRMLLIFFYFVVVSPFGLLVRLLYKPLQLSQPVGNSSWAKRQAPDIDLDSARNQF